LKYTFVKQHDATDCAAACLAMVCLFYNKETTITRQIGRASCRERV
jgi:ATP-binding cassette subfamily B protein